MAFFRPVNTAVRTMVHAARTAHAGRRSFASARILKSEVPDIIFHFAVEEYLNLRLRMFFHVIFPCFCKCEHCCHELL